MECLLFVILDVDLRRKGYSALNCMYSMLLILPKSKSVKYEVFLVMSLWHLHVYQVIVIVSVAASMPVMSHERFIDEISVNFSIFFSHLTLISYKTEESHNAYHLGFCILK